MKRLFSTVILFVFIITICSLIYFRYDFDALIGNTIFFDALTAFTAILGVFGIIYQSNRSKKLDEIQFIFSLNQQYISNPNYQKVLDALEKESYDAYPGDILEIISQNLDFFEPIYILLKQEVIDIALIDNLFCFRFFMIVNNSFVQDNVLTPHKEHYNNIVLLHYIWKTYRQKKNLDIPFSSSDLSKLDWYNDICLYNMRDYRIKKELLIDKTEIREAALEDIDSINRLYYQLIGQYTIDINIASQLEKIKKDSNNFIFVASVNEKIVGTIQCTICHTIAFNGHPNMLIDFFVVDKLYRNKGIGKLLFQKVESIAQRNNVKSIVAVLSGNLKIEHKFYKKMGFDISVKGFRMEKC